MIAPVLVFKLAPPGSAPDCTAKLVALVAATVKLIVPPFATVPKLPAAVVHAGASVSYTHLTLPTKRIV